MRKEPLYRIGFTGTRKGMTGDQRCEFALIMLRENPDEFHHGCCIGADEEAHNIVREILPNCIIVGHPPNRNQYMAKLLLDRRRTPYWYTIRNGHIVTGTRYLIAMPAGSVKIHRGSGTWQTIRLAETRIKLNDIDTSPNKRLSIIYPNGSSINTGDI